MHRRAAFVFFIQHVLLRSAQRQSWPARTVTLVVPFAAGGGTEVIARVVAEKLSARLGQPAVVENKAGAASAIGTAYAAKLHPTVTRC